MKKEDSATKAMSVSRALRDAILDADSDSLSETLSEFNIDAGELAATGKAAAKKALESVSESVDEVGETDASSESDGLHEALGVLLQLLRRRDNLSEEELADLAEVDPAEIRRIEFDRSYTPAPRTIYQLELTFKLPRKTLVKLSGLTRSHSADFKGEVLRFAAHSKSIQKITREERKLLNEFVKFLSCYTDSDSPK
jgi:transcriptional regulator with XRE-family HTH domain